MHQDQQGSVLTTLLRSQLFFCNCFALPKLTIASISLQLLDSLPEDEAHDRWRFALQLLAVSGLHPEELRHLRIKDGACGPEL